MMNFKEFQEYVRNNVKDYLPNSYASAEICFTDSVKNNDTYLSGITIRKEYETVAPNIYLNSFFEEYQNGKDIDEIVGDIADARIEVNAPYLEEDILKKLTNYDAVKDKLAIRLCDKDDNTEKLKQIVYTEHGDFAATYSIVLGKDAEGITSTAITPKLFEKWGISMEQLHQDALLAERNKGARFLDMESVLRKLMEPYAEENNLLDSPDETVVYTGGMELYCLTNSDKLNGASVILQEDVMKKIGELLEGNYYILPSSIHEVLIIPEASGVTTEELSDMVHEVNCTEVTGEERLSDNVQFYDLKAAVIENAKKRDARLVMEEAQAVPEKRSIHDRLKEKKQQSDERNMGVGERPAYRLQEALI